MTESISEKEKSRAYYLANREEIKDKSKRYRQENKEKITKWKEDNKDKLSEYNKEYLKQYYQNNKERHRERGKAWSDRNREKLNEKNREWKRNNHDKVMEQWRKRRARQLSIEGGHFTDAEFHELCEKYGNKCLRCGNTGKLTADHVIPISLGMPHTDEITNIQPLCLSCNSKKHTKTVDYRP